MADSKPDIDRDEAARIGLEPDAFHEEDGLSIDCPQCGATVSVMQVVKEGRCPGYVDADEKEGEGESPREGGCSATLSFELVWAE